MTRVINKLINKNSSEMQLWETKLPYFFTKCKYVTNYASISNFTTYIYMLT